MHSYIRTPAAAMLISTTLASTMPPEWSWGDDGHGRIVLQASLLAGLFDPRSRPKPALAGAH